MKTDAGERAPATPGNSLGRIWFLATTTFTQLLRMKTLYFLLIFTLVIVFASTFNVFEYAAEQQLKLLKDVSLGAMSLFTSVFAIVATAILIPRDIEDRTLYTILAKPVPRYNYLVGKLLGVLLVIAVSLAVMDLISSAVLYLRQEIVLSGEFGNAAGGEGALDEETAAYRQRILAQGLTWNLQSAVVAIFYKASVITAVTMLVSTVASSSLFTIIVSFVIFFIGHVQSIARDYWMDYGGGGGVMTILAALLPILFPDMQLFNMVDAVVAGEAVPLAALLKLSGLTAMYLVVYTIAAQLVFAGKEL